MCPAGCRNCEVNLANIIICTLCSNDNFLLSPDKISCLERKCLDAYYLDMSIC